MDMMKHVVVKNDLEAMKVSLLKEVEAQTKVSIDMAVDPLRSEISELKSRVGAMEAVGSLDRASKDKIAQLEGAIARLRRDPPTASQNTTAVFGGLNGASSKIEVDKWVSYVLRAVNAPVAGEIFTKGAFEDFNGVAFAKFASVDDMSNAVEKVRKAALEYDGRKIWAAPDQVLEARVLNGLLFATKSLLTTWGEDRQSLWVDLEQSTVLFNKEEVLRAKIIDNNIVIDYGIEWKEYLQSNGNEWDEKLRTYQEKLNKRPLPKGSGKGKKKE